MNRLLIPKASKFTAVRTSRRSPLPSGRVTSRDRDMVPNLSLQNLAAIEIGKDFMLSHGYIKNDFDVHKWAAPEFAEEAAKQLIEKRWKKIKSDRISKPGARLG